MTTDITHDTNDDLSTETINIATNIEETEQLVDTIEVSYNEALPTFDETTGQPAA